MRARRSGPHPAANQPTLFDPGPPGSSRGVAARSSHRTATPTPTPPTRQARQHQQPYRSSQARRAVHLGHADALRATDLVAKVAAVLETIVAFLALDELGIQPGYPLDRIDVIKALDRLRLDVEEVAGILPPLAVLVAERDAA